MDEQPVPNKADDARSIAPEEPPDRGADSDCRLRVAGRVATNSQKILRFCSRLLGERFVRNVAVLAGGTAIGQVLLVAVAPVITRLYTPEEFGLFGVYAAILGVVCIVVSLRFELAIPLPQDEEDGAAVAVLALASIPLTMAVAGLSLWYFRSDVAAWTKTPGLAAYLWLLPVGMLGAGMYAVFGQWAVRTRSFGELATTRLSQSVGGAVAQIALFPFGAVGLILGQIVGSAMGSGRLAFLTFRDSWQSFRAMSFSRLARVAVRYRRFPQISTFSGLLGPGSTHLPLLLVAAFYGPFIAGQFALVQRILNLPMGLVGAAIASVFVGEGAVAARNSPVEFRALFVRCSRVLGGIAAAIVVVFVALGPLMFEILFGSQWGLAGSFARFLSPLAAAQLVASPLAQTFNILGRQRTLLGLDLLRLLLTVGGLVCAVWIDLDPTQAVALFGMAGFASYVSYWLVAYKSLAADSIRMQTN